RLPPPDLRDFYDHCGNDRSVHSNGHDPDPYALPYLFNPHLNVVQCRTGAVGTGLAPVRLPTAPVRLPIKQWTKSTTQNTALEDNSLRHLVYSPTTRHEAVEELSRYTTFQP